MGAGLLASQKRGLLGRYRENPRRMTPETSPTRLFGETAPKPDSTANRPCGTVTASALRPGGLACRAIDQETKSGEGNRMVSLYLARRRTRHCTRRPLHPAPSRKPRPTPPRNITLVLPFAAGSGTDTTTRHHLQGTRHRARRRHGDRQQGRRQRLDRGELRRARQRPTATRCSSPPTPRIRPIRIC